MVCCLYWYGILSSMPLLCEEIVFPCAILHSTELYTDSIKMWLLGWWFFFFFGCFVCLFVFSPLVEIWNQVGFLFHVVTSDKGLTELYKLSIFAGAAPFLTSVRLILEYADQKLLCDNSLCVLLQLLVCLCNSKWSFTVFCSTMQNCRCSSWLIF